MLWTCASNVSLQPQEPAFSPLSPMFTWACVPQPAAVAEGAAGADIAVRRSHAVVITWVFDIGLTLQFSHSMIFPCCCYHPLVEKRG